MDLHWETGEENAFRGVSAKGLLGKPVGKMTENQNVGRTSKPKHKRKRTASLKELCPEDKKRVANLIHHLAKLGEEKGAVSRQLEQERDSFEKAVEALMDDQRKLLTDRENIQKELSGCQSLLAQFQREVLAKQEELSATLSSALSPLTSKVLDGRNSTTITNVLDSYIDNFETADTNHRHKESRPSKNGQLSFVELSPDKEKPANGGDLAKSWSSISSVSHRPESIGSYQAKSSKSFAKMKQELLEEQRVLRQHLLEQEAALHEKQRMLHEKQLEVDRRMRNFDAFGSFSEDDVIKRMTEQVQRSQQLASRYVHKPLHEQQLSNRPDQSRVHGEKVLTQSSRLNTSANQVDLPLMSMGIQPSIVSKSLRSSVQSSKGVQVNDFKVYEGHGLAQSMPNRSLVRQQSPISRMDTSTSLTGSVRLGPESIRGTAEFHNSASSASILACSPKRSNFVGGNLLSLSKQEESGAGLTEHDVLGEVFFIQ